IHGRHTRCCRPSRRISSSLVPSTYSRSLIAVTIRRSWFVRLPFLAPESLAAHRAKHLRLCFAGIARVSAQEVIFRAGPIAPVDLYVVGLDPASGDVVILAYPFTVASASYHL